MARGKKHSDEIKEQAYALYALSNNYADVSRQLGIAHNTIQRWIKEKPPDELDEVRREKKMDFIEQASEIINKGLSLIDRRVTTALERETEFEALIGEIFSTDSEGISEKEKNALISKIKQLQLQKLGDITTAVGTLYDKRALAKGENTGNVKISFELPTELKDYAE